MFSVVELIPTVSITSLGEAWVTGRDLVVGGGGDSLGMQLLLSRSSVLLGCIVPCAVSVWKE